MRFVAVSGPVLSRRTQEETELIGQEPVATGPIGEQVQLLLLDPVLHLTPPTIDVLVEFLRITRHIDL